MTDNEETLIDALERYYSEVLIACLKSGKWTMTQAKNEALCAIKNWHKDRTDLNAAIEAVVNEHLFAQEPTTGDE